MRYSGLLVCVTYPGETPAAFDDDLRGMLTRGALRDPGLGCETASRCGEERGHPMIRGKNDWCRPSSRSRVARQFAAGNR